MAKLYFYYSSMNAGKSTVLLQSSYNYRERGMNPNVAKIVVAEVVRLRFFPNQLSPHGLSADFTNGEI